MSGEIGQSGPDVLAMLDAAAFRIRAETWANPDAQARYLRALENAERSLYCVLAGTPSDRRQCVAEWAEILGGTGQ